MPGLVGLRAFRPATVLVGGQERTPKSAMMPHPGPQVAIQNIITKT